MSAPTIASTTAVPGLTGIEHVGLTVPDIEVASRFFAAVLGAEPIYDIGPFAEPQEWMAHHLASATAPAARIHRMRVLAIANGPALELIELDLPPGQTADHARAGWHMAFYVEDMDRGLAALKAHGVEILSGPVSMTEGPSAGLTWLYFKTPWGAQLELVSYPGGIAAYRARTREMWRPT